MLWAEQHGRFKNFHEISIRKNIMKNINCVMLQICFEFWISSQKDRTIIFFIGMLKSKNYCD